MAHVLLKIGHGRRLLFLSLWLVCAFFQNNSLVAAADAARFITAQSSGCYVRLPSYNRAFFDEVGDSATDPNICMARAEDYFNWFRVNGYVGPYVVSFYKNGYATVSRSSSQSVQANCPAGWICPENPIYTSKIGVWYSVWHRNKTKDGNFLNDIKTADQHWQDSPYQPVLGFYDSSDPHVLDAHFAQLRKMGTDFLIIDHTNGLNADYRKDPNTGEEDWVVASNIQALYQYVNNLFENSTGRQIKLSLAMGGGLWSLHDIKEQLKEDNWAWEYAYKRFSRISYQLNNKALLIIQNSYDAVLADGQTCTKTHTPRPCPTAPNWDDSRFAIRRSVGVVSTGNPGVALGNPYFFPSFDYVYGTTTNLSPMGTTGWWGWTYEYPQFVTSETVGVIPGADNTWGNGGTTLLDRENGNYFMKEWVRAISANPQHIILGSYNEFSDGNAIEPARARTDLNNFPGPRRAIPWTDSYGTEVPDWYLQIATAYGNLRTGLTEGMAYRDQDSMNAYTVAGGTLFLLSEAPHGKPVIMLPAGTIKKLLGGPNPFLSLPSNGTLVQAFETAPGVMADGKLVLFDSLSVAQVLSNPAGTVIIDPETYYLLPYSGTIRSKSPVISTHGYPPAFVTDQGEMRPTDCQKAISRNQSTVIAVPLSQYGNYPNGGSLGCPAAQ